LSGFEEGGIVWAARLRLRKGVDVNTRIDYWELCTGYRSQNTWRTIYIGFEGVGRAKNELRVGEGTMLGNHCKLFYSRKCTITASNCFSSDLCSYLDGDAVVAFRDKYEL
jgi:hypothetical protein